MPFRENKSIQESEKDNSEDSQKSIGLGWFPQVPLGVPSHQCSEWIVIKVIIAFFVSLSRKISKVH